MKLFCKRRLWNMGSRGPARTACTLALCLATGILFLNSLPEQEGLAQDGQLTSSDKDLNATMTIKIARDKRQHDRLQRIQKYCNDSKNNKDILYQFPNQNHFNFVVSEKYKFIFCSVPKTGTRQWKDALLNIVAIRPLTPNPGLTLFNRRLFNTLTRYPPKERIRILHSYQTFFVVRHPFERLLSAYRDKFIGNTTQLYESVGQDIIRKVRKSTEKADSSGEHKRPTFDEFTSYIDTLPSPSRLWDVHWRPAHHACFPCAINYDYVGYYETVKEDADYILEKLHLDKIVEFQAFNGSKTSELLRTYYSQIPLDRIIRLAEIYRTDFEMFGYTYQDSIKKLFKDWV